MDKHKLEQDIAKSNEAQHLKQVWLNPFLEQARANLFQAFQEANSRDKDLLSDIRMQFGALNALESNINSYIETGKIAKFELEKE